MGADPEDVGRAGVFVLSPSDPETEALEEHEERSDKVWKHEAVSRAELFGRGTVPDSVHPFFQPVPFFYGGCCAPRWSRPRALHQCRQKQIASAAWCRSRGGLLPRGWKGATLRVECKPGKPGCSLENALEAQSLFRNWLWENCELQCHRPRINAETRAHARLRDPDCDDFLEFPEPEPEPKNAAEVAEGQKSGPRAGERNGADDLRGDCLVASTFTDAVRTRVPIDPWCGDSVRWGLPETGCGLPELTPW